MIAAAAPAGHLSDGGILLGAVAVRRQDQQMISSELFYELQISPFSQPVPRRIVRFVLFPLPLPPF